VRLFVSLIMLVTQSSQRRRKDTQRIFNNKSLSILVLLFFTTTLLSSESEVDDSKSNLDLAQIIRSIALIYTDDALDPEVEEFLNYKQEIIWEDNAYVYLWGMDKITENPYATGKEILEKLVEDDKHYNYEQRPLNFDFLDDYSNHELPEDDLLCKKSEKGCFLSIFENQSQIDSVLSKYDFYIPRYLEFLNYKHFNQIASRRLESALPSYRTLTKSQQIYHLSILSKLLKSNRIDAISILSKELDLLKVKLEKVDSLISKMIAVELISENVELFNLLYQKKYINLKSKTDISVFDKLTHLQITLYQAMFEEHSKGLKMIFDWTSDYKTLTKKAKNPLGDSLMKLFYFFVSKPNLTVNTHYHKIVKHLLRTTGLPVNEFYHVEKEFNDKPEHDRIRNYLGYTMMSTMMPSYLDYQARVFDIDMKIQLMRLITLSNSIDELIQSDDFKSSYDKTSPFIKDGKLCYTGSVDINEKYRCLLIINN